MKTTELVFDHKFHRHGEVAYRILPISDTRAELSPGSVWCWGTGRPEDPLCQDEPVARFFAYTRSNGSGTGRWKTGENLPHPICESHLRRFAPSDFCWLNLPHFECAISGSSDEPFPNEVRVGGL